MMFDTIEKTRTRSRRPEGADGVDKQFVFEQLRSEVSYEAGLISQRVTWFVGSQSIFFASLVISLDPSQRSEGLHAALYFPQIPILAMFVCVITFLSIGAASSAAKLHREELNRFVKANPAFEQVYRRSEKPTPLLRRYDPQFLVIAFLVTWVLLVADAGAMLQRLFSASVGVMRAVLGG